MHPDKNGNVVLLVDVEGRFNLRGREVEGRKDILEVEPSTSACLFGPVEGLFKSKYLSFEIGA
jgi:hypothetical protein